MKARQKAEKMKRSQDHVLLIPGRSLKKLISIHQSDPSGLSYAVFLWLPKGFPDRSMFLIKIMATLCCCYQSWIIFAIKTHTLRRLTFISEAKATPGNNSCSLEAVLGVVLPSLNTNTCTETELITCYT